MLQQLIGFDVASYLSHVIPEQRTREIDFDFAGDFLIVSELRREEKEDGPISQLVVERADSNSGPETRQDQKKEVGGETETAAQPDAAVELEPKYSTVRQDGRGCRAYRTEWGELAVCVIVYHISIDHSHLNWKHWATCRFSAGASEVMKFCFECVLQCNFGTVNPFWTFKRAALEPHLAALQRVGVG